MGIKFANNVRTSLASPATTIATSLTVASATGMPALSGDDYFYGTIFDNSGNIEIVKVTALSGTTLTCERASDSTTALAWSSGASFELRANAAALRELRSDYFFESPITFTASTTITPGNNAMTPGPVTIASGVTITVPTGSTWTIV